MNAIEPICRRVGRKDFEVEERKHSALEKIIDQNTVINLSPDKWVN